MELRDLLRNLSPDIRELNPDLFPAAHAPASDKSEHLIQVALIQMVEAEAKRHPELALLFAIPNGGQRSKAVAGKLKAEGVKPGVPDLCLPVPRHGYAGLWIEMKRPGERPTNWQPWWIEALREYGHRVEVCHSAEQALKVLLDYLK